VADSAAHWLPDHPDATVAILVPRNQRGFEMADEFKRRKIDYVDGLLRSTTGTRSSAGVLGNVLRYLADPSSTPRLVKIFQVWRRGDRGNEAATGHQSETIDVLKKCRNVEEFTAPGIPIGSKTSTRNRTSTPRCHNLEGWSNAGKRRPSCPSIS